jgi:sulfur carrier protein
MSITVNGEPAALAENVAALLQRWYDDPRPHGVAVAVNGEVVRRDEWPRHPLGDGDAIEIVTAVQGG